MVHATPIEEVVYFRGLLIKWPLSQAECPGGTAIGRTFRRLHLPHLATVCTTTSLRVLIHHTRNEEKNGKAERKETRTNYDCV
jgi:hypothetical protein